MEKVINFFEKRRKIILIFISIPVHENPQVILDQIINIKKYIDAIFIVHVSKNANFPKSELIKLLKNNKLDEIVIVNPKSISTNWGDIISTHIENIKFIQQISSKLEDKIVFHSSNDMIVRKGVQYYIEQNKYLFNTRYCDRVTHWWPGNVALSDIQFRKLLSYLGHGRIVASQIEGSMYDLEVLSETLKLIEKYDLLSSNLRYPREELFFSSIAYGLGVKPTNEPYVFSEVHIFDRNVWNFWKFTEKYFSERLSKKCNKIFNDLYFRSRLYKISKKDIINIRSGKVNPIEFFEGGNDWIIYKDSDNLFAVKRVERNINNPIRKFINMLDL